MPKKVRSAPIAKGAKAKEQKNAARAEKEALSHAQKQQKLDKEWAVGTNPHANAREKKEQEKEAARLASKAAKQAAMEADEADIAKMRVKPGKARKAQKKKKADLSSLEAFLSPAEKKQLKAKNKAGAGKPEKVHSKAVVSDPLLRPNMNRQISQETDEGHVNATGIDAAIGAMTVEDGEEVDRNPTKRGKALYMAFEERMMAEIREENPGLKRSQMKDRIWKAWQKAPENPFRELNR